MLVSRPGFHIIPVVSLYTYSSKCGLLVNKRNAKTSTPTPELLYQNSGEWDQGNCKEFSTFLLCQPKLENHYFRLYQVGDQAGYLILLPTTLSPVYRDIKRVATLHYVFGFYDQAKS